MTHCDNCCDEVKKIEKDWKKICKEYFNNNKNNLVSLIKKIGKENNCDNIMNEDDIMHIVLVEPKQIDEKEIINTLDDETLEEYNNADEKGKKMILKYYLRGKISTINEVQPFIKNEIKALGPKELIEKIKENLPSQFHDALIQNLK